MTQRTRQADKFGTSGEAKTPKSKIKAKTESQTLAESNPGRIALTITNTGATAVWLAAGATAVAEEGIMLAKEGGAHVIDYYTGVVSVITKESESVVSFLEI